MSRHVGQAEAGDEEQRDEDGSGLRQEGGRTPRTEHRAGGTGTEAGTGVRALAALHEHDADDGQGQHRMDEDDDGLQHARIPCETRNETGGSGRGHHAEELFRLERGASDEATIDVRLGEQLAGVGRLDAAAVEDPQLTAYHSIIPGDACAEDGMDLLRLGRRSGLPGADGPDRFVRQKRTGEGLHPGHRHHRVHRPASDA